MLKLQAFKKALKKRCLECTGMAVSLDQCDGASGNDLYEAACQATDLDGSIRDSLLCFSHSLNHVVLTVVLGVFGMEAIHPLYVLAKYFNMGDHWTRLGFGLRAFLRRPGRVVFVGRAAATQRSLVYTSTCEIYARSLYIKNRFWAEGFHRGGGHSVYLLERWFCDV